MIKFKFWIIFILIHLPSITSLAMEMIDRNNKNSKIGLVFIVDQKTFNEELNFIWDNFRAARVWLNAASVYDNIYIARGEECRDEVFMKDLWEKAFCENDLVDYISHVHGGNQWLKDDWQPEGYKNKLRLAYSEACNGGANENFIIHNNAWISAGHKGHSASPFFSFRLLFAWLEGLDFESAFNRAFKEGQENLQTGWMFMIAQYAGGYKDYNEVIDNSEMQFKCRKDINPKEVTVYTKTILK